MPPRRPAGRPARRRQNPTPQPMNLLEIMSQKYRTKEGEKVKDVVFKVRKGRPYSDAQAAQFGKAIELLKHIYGGSFEAKHIVEEVKNDCNGLRDLLAPMFPDDHTCAERWKLHLARQLINSYEYEVVTDVRTVEVSVPNVNFEFEHEPAPPTGQNTPVYEDKKRHYSDTTGSQVAGQSSAVLEQFTKDLQAFLDRYSNLVLFYTSLDAVFRGLRDALAWARREVARQRNNGTYPSPPSA